jgi:hypothetical protein
LSTAVPSLGGALPKLATLKIEYETSRVFYNQAKSKGFGFFSSSTNSSIGSSSYNMPRMRAHTTLSSGMTNEDEQSEGTINVLSTQTEASMSSSSFSIPRRSTIDADVSSFFYMLLIDLFSKTKFLHRVNHIK